MPPLKKVARHLLQEWDFGLDETRTRRVPKQPTSGNNQEWSREGDLQTIGNRPQLLDQLAEEYLNGATLAPGVHVRRYESSVVNEMVIGWR
jgi:hypothetical protein